MEKKSGLKDLVIRFMLCIVLLAVVAIFNLNCPSEAHRIYGFWPGMWHGFIAWVDLVLMAFGKPGVAVYSQLNNGGWYAWGFLFGAGTYLGTLGGMKSR